MVDKKVDNTQLPVDGRIISALSHAQQETMGGLAELGQTFMQGLTDYNREILRFVSGRVEEDIDLNSDLAKCQSLDEVIKLQNTFVDKAIREYAEEAERLTKMSAQILSDDFDIVSGHLQVITEEAEQIEAEIEKEKASQTSCG